MKQGIWISFDLGVRGDYEGLYGWLDAHKAEECGDSFGHLWYEYEGDLIESLSKDIEDAIDVTKKTRIYVVWRNRDNGKMNGRFIIGRRKAAPWAGSAGGADDSESDES